MTRKEFLKRLPPIGLSHIISPELMRSQKTCSEIAREMMDSMTPKVDWASDYIAFKVYEEDGVLKSKAISSSNIYKNPTDT